MLMLSHAHEATRDDLYSVITPEPTDTWKPVPHHEVVNTLTDRAAARGLVVKSERFALLDGTLYGANGVQTRLPGARLFGSLDFAPIPGMPFPAGWRQFWLFRSKNQQLPAGAAAASLPHAAASQSTLCTE